MAPPGKARNNLPGGGVGAVEEGEAKGRSGVSTATGGSLAALGRTWDRTNIDANARQIPGNKSGGRSVVGG